MKSIIRHCTKFVFNGYSRIRLLLRRRALNKILILGHIRSGSTLLLHILASHPDITGFGENRMTYDKMEDFEKLVCQTLRHLRKLRMPETYWVDKIVHLRSFKVHDQIMRNSDVYAVFIVRDPHDSILSIRRNSDDDLAASIQYYIGMLGELERLGQLLPGKDRGFFLTYDQLLEDTNAVFSGLQRFLGLKVPLEETYRLLPTTGISLYGDWSENIKSGRILRPPKDRPIIIPEKAMAPALEAYLRCSRTLRNHCTHLGPRNEIGTG
ncbi:MAG: sulfotransferase [Candidatus Aminicenantes bacterium]|nr:sulfotransferase [Candidatus Aminicenantes bacterium]